MARPSTRLRCVQLEDRTTPAVPPVAAPSILPVPPYYITVTTAADVVDANDGVVSLREALAEAQLDPPGDAPFRGTPTVKFADALAGKTITVSRIGGTTVGPAAFELTKYVSIEGSGQKIVRPADAPRFRFFTVLSDGTIQMNGGVGLSKVELSGGYSDGFGGAVYSRGGTVSVDSAVVADNSAAGLGGAIYSEGGYVFVTNATLTGNTARPTADGTSRGGAVYLTRNAANEGYVSLRLSTLAGNAANQGSQVYAAADVTVSLAQSILYTPGAAADVVAIKPTDGQYAYGKSVIGKVQGVTGDFIISADPKLGPLQDNGGLTRTTLPQAGSSAIDAGDGDLAASGARDQRGFVRGVGRKTDLGAAEAGATATGVEYTPPTLAVGAAAGQPPEVRVLRADGAEVKRFLAYGSDFRGGVRVAMADLTGDGIPDIITAAGAGGGPHVKVFDGYTYQEIRSFYAFEAGFRGGVSLAVGDVNYDGTMEIVVAAGAGGGPHVRVLDGKTLAEVKSFFAFDQGFRGGVSVAFTDFGGSLVVGAGPGGGPHVRVLDAQNLTEQASFYAYDPAFAGGVTVTYANGHIFTGTVSGPPHVKGFRDTRYYGYGIGPAPTEMASFYAGDATSTFGVMVGAAGRIPWPQDYAYTSPPVDPSNGVNLFTSAGGTLVRYTVAYDDDYTDPANPKYRTKVETDPFGTPVSGVFAGVGGLPPRVYAYPALSPKPVE